MWRRTRADDQPGLFSVDDGGQLIGSQPAPGFILGLLTTKLELDAPGREERHLVDVRLSSVVLSGFHLYRENSSFAFELKGCPGILGHRVSFPWQLLIGGDHFKIHLELAEARLGEASTSQRFLRSADENNLIHCVCNE